MGRRYLPQLGRLVKQERKFGLFCDPVLRFGTSVDMNRQILFPHPDQKNTQKFMKKRKRRGANFDKRHSGTSQGCFWGRDHLEVMGLLDASCQKKGTN